MSSSHGCARTLALLFILPLLAPPSAAEEVAPPEIRTVVVTFAGRELRVEARLWPGLPAAVGQRLASGLPTTTSWRIRLLVSRPVWWDGLKDERLYEVTAVYRPMTGDYSVERRLDGRLLETRVVPGRDEAALALARLPAIPSFTMGRHLVGKPLVVKVSCAYAADLALGVVPTTAETDWARSAVFEWKEVSGP